MKRHVPLSEHPVAASERWLFASGQAPADGSHHVDPTWGSIRIRRTWPTRRSTRRTRPMLPKTGRTPAASGVCRMTAIHRIRNPESGAQSASEALHKRVSCRLPLRLRPSPRRTSRARHWPLSISSSS